MRLVDILLVCSVSQAATLVYLLMRGRRLSRRVVTLYREMQARAERMDELAAEHDEIRRLFSGKAHFDIQQAVTRMDGEREAGPTSSDF